jgi:site-specific recombinase XerD
MNSSQPNRPREGDRRNTPGSQVSAHENWRHALSRLKDAYATNTIRAYRADFSIFEVWCRKAESSALPASPETVAAFLSAQSKSAAPATVSRRRAAISKMHKLLKLDNPVPTEEVNLATRKAFRLKGSRQKQALGLTASIKRKLIAACLNDPRGLRDRALIAMGYDTLCRRSELVGLRSDDIVVATDGSGTILVRKAKADQLGHGRLAYLSTETVTMLQRWLLECDATNSLIFRSIDDEKVRDRPLAPSAVSEILKRRAVQAGLDATIASRLSGHSLRVGAAQDMAAAGIDLGAIMHAGGWKTPAMVMRYIEHMDVRKSGMARLYVFKGINARLED